MSFQVTAIYQSLKVSLLAQSLGCWKIIHRYAHLYVCFSLWSILLSLTLLKSMLLFLFELEQFLSLSFFYVSLPFAHFISIFPFLCSLSQERTELHDVAEKGDVVAVRKLLKTSININSRTGRVSSTTYILHHS